MLNTPEEDIFALMLAEEAAAAPMHSIPATELLTKAPFTASATKPEIKQSAPELPSRHTWSSARAGFPVSFARSALFSVSERNSAEAVDRPKQMLIPATKGIELGYIGPRLNQTHALVFQSLVEATQGATRDLVISHGDVLKLFGRKESTNTEARRWLWAIFDDLAQARLALRTPRTRYVGGLIHSITHDKATGRLAISLGHGLASLFQNELVLEATIERATLGNSQLTLWLHSYIASQYTPFPVAVTELKRLSGSELPLKVFRYKLRESMSKLSAGSAPLVMSWSIDGKDKLVVCKKKTKVLMVKPVAMNSRTNVAEKDSAIPSNSAIARARAQRAKVAL